MVVVVVVVLQPRKASETACYRRFDLRRSDQVCYRKWYAEEKNDSEHRRKRHDVGRNYVTHVTMHKHEPLCTSKDPLLCNGGRHCCCCPLSFVTPKSRPLALSLSPSNTDTATLTISIFDKFVSFNTPSSLILSVQRASKRAKHRATAQLTTTEHSITMSAPTFINLPPPPSEPATPSQIWQPK